MPLGWLVEEREVDLGDLAAVGLEVFGGDAELGADLVHRPQGCRGGDVEVRGKDGWS